jgi:hypothetical protein
LKTNTNKNTDICELLFHIIPQSEEEKNIEEALHDIKREKIYHKKYMRLIARKLLERYPVKMQ